MEKSTIWSSMNAAVRAMSIAVSNVKKRTKKDLTSVDGQLNALGVIRAQKLAALQTLRNTAVLSTPATH